MNELGTLLSGPSYAVPKIVSGERLRATAEPVFNNRRLKRRSKYDALYPQVARLYASGVSYEHMANELGATKTVVHMMVGHLIRRGMITRRARPEKQQPRRPRPKRVRPMLQRVQRVWPPSTPCSCETNDTGGP